MLFRSVDQIRTTVCQAQLLMRKKMRQYFGLVDTAERGEEKMFAEDLQVRAGGRKRRRK